MGMNDLKLAMNDSGLLLIRKLELNSCNSCNS